MIISRSPLRISLGGGGTDLPSYYEQFGGFLIAAAIDKYVYISAHETTRETMLVRYSQIEEVKNSSELKHPIIKAALEILDINDVSLEITSMADVGAGTGLGSSGSFTTALLKALYKYKRGFIHTKELAEMAAHIEIDILQEPIGKQDQYIASYGGITSFDFDQDGKVVARSLDINSDTVHLLEENLLLFSTGFTRSAPAMLRDQDKKSREKDSEMLNNLHFIKEIGRKSSEALTSGNLSVFADLMNVHWEHKRKRSSGMTNNNIDEWYKIAINNGALGGKLIGAGGGGFLMFYAEDPYRLRQAMAESGLKEMRFRFDFEGTKII